jgi:hypothetical protein
MTDCDILALVAHIKAFIKDRRPCVGHGWAPVEPGDVAELCGFIREIVEGKWDKDCDGDLPVNFRVIDRTRYEPMHFFEVPYAETCNTTEERQRRMDNLIANVQLAVRDLERWSRNTHHYRTLETPQELARRTETGDYQCQNCGCILKPEEFKDTYPVIPYLLQRIDPGEPVPAGTCPYCEALVQQQAGPLSPKNKSTQREAVMKHVRTIAVTRLFEGDVTREALSGAMEVPLVGNLGSKVRPHFEWRFDLGAGGKLLRVLKKWNTFDEDIQRMTSPAELDGRFLCGWKVNIVPTDGFRVEIVEYDPVTSGDPEP